MNYTNFKEKLLSEMRLIFPNSKVELHEVNKNNSTHYDAITIHTEAQPLSPCIRLSNYYDEYMNPSITTSFADIVERLSNILKANAAANGKKDELFNMLTDFEAVKDRIVCRLVNRHMNQDLLNTIPFHTFLDEFALTYSLIKSTNYEAVESIRITNALMSQWNISLDHLYKVALDNTIRLFPKTTYHMDELLSRMLGQSLPDMQEDSSSTMYVLSNQQGINGSTVLIYPDALKDFVLQYKINVKYVYILPSSIHESILVPANNLSMKEQFLQMVYEVNSNEVSADEVLSNQILIYNCADSKIVCVKEGIIE